MAPRKRAHDEVDVATEDIPQRDLKQTKTDAVAQAAAESNSESSYVSAAAAVFSESDGDSESTHSSHDELESDLSISSEEPSSDESDSDEEEGDEGEESVDDVGQEQIINVRPGSKPNISKEGTDGSLLRRLKSFLPEMQEANEELEREREAGTLGKRDIEACDDNKPHIEMNLGLGVLEEKGEDGDSEEDDDMSDDDDDHRRDVMQKLMGDRQPSQRGTHIQEVGEG